jgi:hypothetical protein
VREPLVELDMGVFLAGKAIAGVSVNVGETGISYRCRTESVLRIELRNRKNSLITVSVDLL